MLKTAVIAALSAAAITFAGAQGVLVEIKDQLDPTDYKQAKQVLERLDGKYKSGKRHFVFDYDPTPLIQDVVATGKMPENKPLAFFPTPEPIVKQLVEMVGLDGGYEDTAAKVRILEPSAGRGAILNELCSANGWPRGKSGEVTPLGVVNPVRLPMGVTLDAVEFDPFNATRLRNQGFSVLEMNFLEYQPEADYDYILMNPPFSVAGNPTAYVDHVLHAFSMLAEGGQMIAIVPKGYTYASDKKQTEFRSFVQNCAHVHELGRGAFRASGTLVDTHLLYFVG